MLSGRSSRSPAASRKDWCTEMTQTSLFPESVELRVQRLDGNILHLICGGVGGRLGLPLEDGEKAVLECLRYRRGLANAMPIREITQRTKLDARSIKQAVRDLRIDFSIPIGSWKHADRGGYFLIVDDQDRKAYVKDVLDQVRSELSVLKAVAGRQAHLELLGQMQIEAQQESEASHV